jgi:flagellar biosynthetic protein FlhB
MAKQGDKHSRTEAPTAKRMREARKEGQIPKSQEIAAWASVLAAVYLVQWTIQLGADRFGALMRETAEVIAVPEEASALRLLGEWLFNGLIVIAPLLLGTMLLGIVTNLGQVGFAPSMKLLKPKFDRVNPIAGFKRMIGVATLWETAKVTLKLVILAFVATKIIFGVVPQVVDAGRLSVPATVGLVATSALTLARNVALAGLVLAAVDYGFQRKRVMGSLRMTKHEVKEEHKENEGDPRMKQAIRSKQLSVSRNRMMAEIGTADVVLVNPTHVAVALKYDADFGPPTVIAKGAGIIADRIREKAAEHGVPMVADVPLARTIFRACEIGDVIPAELYDAVARVLAFIFALKRRGQSVVGIHELPGGSQVPLPDESRAAPRRGRAPAPAA